MESGRRSLDADTRRTLESFGYEWTTFDKIQPEDETFWQGYFADVPLDRLRGRVGLDAGCGKGRFAFFTAPYLDHLVALDGSEAIVTAKRNLSHQANTSCVKGDVRSLPFADRSFGFICCLGVLHHLTDPRAGFDELVRVLKDDSYLLIYVYSRPTDSPVRVVALSAATWMRKVTVRLPHPILRALSAPLSMLLYVSFVIPGLVGERFGWTSLKALPLQTYRRRPLRSLWLDTFDRLSAPIEHRYSWPEIAAWFDTAHLSVEAVREDAGLFVLARKLPAA